MGNTVVKESEEPSEGVQSLNLSRRVTPEQFLKHSSGEFLEGCLLEVPWGIYYNTISMYEEINASFNFISEIPEELSLHVPHLRMLNFSHNQITSVPPSFNLLLHLQVLDLSHNRLKIVPESITCLRQLHTLNIANNNITELPGTISKLGNLSKLNVSNNSLRVLPGSLVECPKLNVLVSLGNNLIHPPQAICDCGSQATLTFLRERHVPVVSTRPALKKNVFMRVRGQQVLASVANPESASTEYRQALGTSRTNKRKCPLMPPMDATLLNPDHLRDMLLGLIYGAAIADAMALNTERLSEDECQFYYCRENIMLKDRISDHLRLHFSPHDWSCNTDVMLLVLESLMRWGGVVDELEVASQLDQWRIHGYVDIDPSPGHLLSPYMNQVITIEGYSANPHATADTAYKLAKEEISRGIYNVNPRDNSCLPTSLVLGVPNFYKESEVEMNSDRICRATHADPVVRASCWFLSLLMASLLQGKMCSGELSFINLIDDIKEKVALKILEENDREDFRRAFTDVNSKAVSGDDATTSLSLLYTVMSKDEFDFKTEIVNVVMRGGTGVSAHASVVGGILGATIGYSQLPQEWLGELPQENIRLLNIKLNSLLDLFGLP